MLPQWQAHHYHHDHSCCFVLVPVWTWLVFAGRFGRGRSDAEKFLAALQDVYCLERVRVLGDDIRLLKCYPGDWQVSLNP